MISHYSLLGSHFLNLGRVSHPTEAKQACDAGAGSEEGENASGLDEVGGNQSKLMIHS